MTNKRLGRRTLIKGTAGVAFASLAGCSGVIGGDQGEPGHGETEHDHGAIGDPQESREVLVNTARGERDSYHFRPHVTRVTVGGTVTWVLESGTHTATAYHPGNDQPQLVPDGTEEWDSGSLSEQGETFEHTFQTEGVYHYYCKPHERFGMLATVIVGEPNPEEQVALQTVPEDKSETVRGKLKSLNEMVRSELGGHHNGDTTEEQGHEDEHGTDSGGHHDGETTHPDAHTDEHLTKSDDHHGGGTTTDEHHHG